MGGAQGIAGGLKEAGRRSRGPGSGRKAAGITADVAAWPFRRRVAKGEEADRWGRRVRLREGRALAVWSFADRWAARALTCSLSGWQAGSGVSGRESARGRALAERASWAGRKVSGPRALGESGRLG